jgi:alpha-1,2-mannosyltransferase
LRRIILLTRKRLTLWGTVLLFLSWVIYVHTMIVPGWTDRAGRFKASDYIYFYVMGSLVLEGRTDALYDPATHLAESRRLVDPALTLYAPHSNYGPPVAFAFAPLALLPLGWSLSVFLALSALCYGAAVWVVWRECDALRQHGRLIAILAAASPLFLTLFRYAQLSAFSLLLWAVAFVALRRNRVFTAGLTIGCLSFKPQLGIVVGVVLIAAREWRAVAGAVAAVLGQLMVGWLVAGSATMMEYFRVLWTLMLNPGLVQIYPSEVHSLRGFFQLLIPSTAVVNGLSLVALVIVIVVAVRSWQSRAPLALRWGQVILLTVLGSPHLLTYDLVMLTIPLILFAEWALHNPDHPLQPAISGSLVPLYLAPFSSNLARLIPVQLSVPVMAYQAWCVYSVCTNEVPSREPRPGAPVSSS